MCSIIRTYVLWNKGKWALQRWIFAIWWSRLAYRKALPCSKTPGGHVPHYLMIETCLQTNPFCGKTPGGHLPHSDRSRLVYRKVLLAARHLVVVYHTIWWSWLAFRKAISMARPLVDIYHTKWWSSPVYRKALSATRHLHCYGNGRW